MTVTDDSRRPGASPRAFDTVGKFLNIGLAMLAVDCVVELAATQFFGGHHVFAVAARSADRIKLAPHELRESRTRH